MKNIPIILYFILLPVLAFTQQTINATITHGGLERDYILYVPANYTSEKEVPLLFNFHGYTSNASEQMLYGDFRPIADTAGFIIVHPQGENLVGIDTRHWNVGGWTLSSTFDDVDFTKTLLEKISTDYAIDLQRVYSTGMSNGGYMSFLLACQLSDKIAAIASVTGSMTPETYDACNPQHPTPILQIHGTTDGVVPYGGSNWSKPIGEVIAYWVDFNNASATVNTQDFANDNILDGSTVERQTYEVEASDVLVEHFKVTGGGHTWPGTSLNSFGTNQDINASLEIWNFLSQYRLNELSGETTNIELIDDETVTIKVYPNPIHTQLNIEKIVNQSTNFQLLTITGKEIFSGILRDKSTKVNVAHLLPGVYFLKVENTAYKLIKMR